MNNPLMEYLARQVPRGSNPLEVKYATYKACCYKCGSFKTGLESGDEAETWANDHLEQYPDHKGWGLITFDLKDVPCLDF